MSENDLYKYIGILLLINILSVLYMLFMHCNLGADTYDWKWDTKKNENIAYGLVISCIVIIGILMTFRTMEVIGL